MRSSRRIRFSRRRRAVPRLVRQRLAHAPTHPIAQLAHPLRHAQPALDTYSERSEFSSLRRSVLNLRSRLRQRTKRSSVMMAVGKYLALTGLVVGTTFSAGSVHAQGVAGTWVFHSGSSGACPGLDWHVNSDGRALGGFIAWNEGKSIARVSGTLTGSDFKMTAKEVGGERTASVTGRVEGGNTLTATITGTGGPCDGKTIKVPWMSSANMGGSG